MDFKKSFCFILFGTNPPKEIVVPLIIVVELGNTFKLIADATICVVIVQRGGTGYRCR